MASTPGFEPGPPVVEASALTTAPPLLFITLVMQHFETMIDTNWVMAKYFLLVFC